MTASSILKSSVSVVLLIATVPCADLIAGQVSPGASPDSRVCVNVADFKKQVSDGDWSRAIQAAIDYVSKDNGFQAGGTVFFPPGTYRVDRSIIVGNNPVHWGLRLLGYGATLVGSTTLDKQKLGKVEPEEKGVGVPILILKNPKAFEGAGYCIEGMRFARQGTRTGVAISVPFKDVPKCTTFRSLKIHNQNVGIHINMAWQF